MGDVVAQQVAGLHTNNRALDHTHVVFANAAGVRDGRQQGEAVVLVAQGFNALGVGEGGYNILGDNTEAAVGVGQGAVNLPETGFNGDGAQLLTLVIEQERLSAVFDEGQAILLKSNNLAEGGVFLAFVPHGSGTFPGAEQPCEGNKFRG